MAEVTGDSVRAAIEAEAEADPEFHAALTEGQLSRSDVRDAVARRLGVDADAVKPFKADMVAVMKDLWVGGVEEPPAAPEPPPKKKPRKPAAPRKKKAAPAPAPAPAEPAPAASTNSLLRGTRGRA